MRLKKLDVADLGAFSELQKRDFTCFIQGAGVFQGSGGLDVELDQTQGALDALQTSEAAILPDDELGEYVQVGHGLQAQNFRALFNGKTKESVESFDSVDLLQCRAVHDLQPLEAAKRGDGRDVDEFLAGPDRQASEPAFEGVFGETQCFGVRKLRVDGLAVVDSKRFRLRVKLVHGHMDRSGSMFIPILTTPDEPVQRNRVGDR